MRITENEHKKMKKLVEDKKKPTTTTTKKQTTQEAVVPAWFNQNLNELEPTNTEQEEMDLELTYASQISINQNFSYDNKLEIEE